MKKLISKSVVEQKNIPNILLNWYKDNCRTLPWRSKNEADLVFRKNYPYFIWVSEIMLQQTTVKAVIPYFNLFIDTWPTVFDLTNAKEEDVYSIWAGLGYYSRARNLIKCARIISQDYKGHFPSSVEELLKLPGIGPYTSAAIVAIAFGKKATVVDANVERVMARIFSLRKPIIEVKKQIYALSDKLTPTERPGDYAQAVMDLGATICRPISPLCYRCPLSEVCLSRIKNIVHLVPKKNRRKEKPIRYGTIYVATQGRYVVLVRRPSIGLLPNMLCPPTFGWLDDKALLGPPFAASWKKFSNKIFHTFTHFKLVLSVYKAEINKIPSGFETHHFDQNLIDSLPSLSKKVLTSSLKF